MESHGKMSVLTRNPLPADPAGLRIASESDDVPRHLPEGFAMFSRRLVRRAAVVAAVLAVGVRPAAEVRGSGVAAPKDARPEAEAETAVVVWDEASKTEHLILSASLPSGAVLLVPTPTPPTVAPAGADAIDALSKVTAPRTEIKTKTVTPEFGWPRFDFGGFGSATPPRDAMPKTPAPPAPPAPESITVPVSDAAKVAEWMTKGGYEARPALADWLKGYTGKNWTVTAIKPADAASGMIPPTKLTFKTDKPIFPYREPAEPAADAATLNRSRLLRVFVVTDGRADGTVGESAAWPAKTVYAKKADDAAVGAVAKDAKAPAGGWWVTEFEDLSTPRPATDDIVFTKAAKQDGVERTPNEVYIVTEMPPAWAVNAAVLVGLVVLAVVLIARRKKKPAAPATAAAGPAEPDLL